MPLRRSGQPSPHPERPGRDELIAVLADPDADRRRWAALELDGDAGAVPALLNRLADEDVAVVREALLTTLAAHDTETVARALSSHLSSDDASLRVAVAGALATMAAGTPPLLAALVGDDDPDVRIMTAMILDDLASPAARDWLIRMIDTDAHPNVVTAAIDAFLPLATAEHVDLFERARDRFPDDPFLQFTVDNALPRLAEVRP
jgi:HEAT repeat protein